MQIQQKRNSPGAVERIREALLRLMEEKNYRDVTVNEISRRAGISRQGLYLYFKDKDEILRDQFRSFFEKIIADIRSSGIETIDELISLYTSIVQKHSQYLRILAKNNLGAVLGDVFVSGFSELPPVVPTQRLSRNETENRYINAFWVHAIIQVYTLWINDNMRTSAEEIKRILSDIMKGNYFREKAPAGI